MFCFLCFTRLSWALIVYLNPTFLVRFIILSNNEENRRIMFEIIVMFLLRGLVEISVYTFIFSKHENRRESVKLKVNILVQRSFDRTVLAKHSFQITRSLRQGSLSVEIKQRADRDKVTRNTCVTSVNMTI